MLRKNRVMLFGMELLAALARTPADLFIKWRSASGRTINGSSGKPILLTPAQAVLVARAGQYVGETTPAFKRVYYIREWDARPEELWIPDPEYWDDRSVLHYTTDLRNIPVRVKNRETRGLWDRLLALDPPPRSWARVS